MGVTNNYVSRLENCPLGKEGWSEFENVCVEILEFLFMPALRLHSKQARTYSGINRMDAVFSNRNIIPTDDPSLRNWYHLFIELDARLILFEFKNYDSTEITQNEVDQTRNYLRKQMGRLAIMVCSKKPTDHAHRHRNSIFSYDKKVILLLTKDELKEMLDIKERGEEPSDLIIDLVEHFYIQHE